MRRFRERNGRIPIENDEQKKSEERIARLTRDLADAINEGGAPGRSEARDYAIDLLKDGVDTEVISTPEPRADGAPTQPLNPFGLGIPFLLLGVLMMPLFSVVGLAMAGIGALMCVVGVVMAIFRRRPEAPPEEP